MIHRVAEAGVVAVVVEARKCFDLADIDDAVGVDESGHRGVLASAAWREFLWECAQASARRGYAQAGQ